MATHDQVLRLAIDDYHEDCLLRYRRMAQKHNGSIAWESEKAHTLQMIDETATSVQLFASPSLQLSPLSHVVRPERAVAYCRRLLPLPRTNKDKRKDEEMDEKKEEAGRDPGLQMEKDEAGSVEPAKDRIRRVPSAGILNKIHNVNNSARRHQVKEYKREVAARRACDRGYYTAVPYDYGDQHKQDEEDQVSFRHLART